MTRQADVDSSLARTLIESMQMQVKVYKEWIEGEKHKGVLLMIIIMMMIKVILYSLLTYHSSTPPLNHTICSDE